FVDQETLDADVERIQAYYHDLGFFRVRIGREIAFNDAGTWATLTFVIDEGPRYVVRNITFNGNKRYSEDAWREKLDLKPGQYFDRGYAVQDQTLIQDYYGGRGHIFANVLPDLRFLEEPGQLDLVYQIEEGPRYRVGRIDVRIEGEHPHTRNNVALNRLDLRPGDIVDTRKIRDAERRLKATGVFANNPQQGQVPKIVLIPPEEGDTRTAKRSNQNNVRGQSPDNEPGDQLIDVGLDGMPFVPAEQAKPPAQPPQSPTSRTPGVVRGQSPDNVAVPNGVYASPVPAAALSTRGRAGRAADNTRQPAAAPVRPGAGRAMPAPPSQAGQPPIIRGQNQFAPGSGGGLAELPPSTRPPAYPATGQPVVNSPAYEPYVETVPPGGAVATDGPVEPIGGGVLEDPNVVDPNGEIFGEPPDRFIDPTIVVTETQTGRLMFGVGVNSDAGVVGNIVLDEQNFDWRRVPTSWEDIRNATAFRGAGQQFRIEAVPGTQLQRYVINFREPYLLDTPISLGLSGYFYTRFFNEWSEQRLGGRISLGYQLTPDLSATVAFRGEQVKIFNAAGGGAVPGTPQEIVDAQGTNALYGIRGQIAHDTRDSAFLPTEGHYVELGYEQVFGSFLFPVGTIEGRQYFLIHQRPDRSGRHVLSFSAKAGFSSSNTPVYEKFYAGGFSTLRGFRFRGASPVDPLTGIAVGGNFEFIGSVEYMVPLSADDALRAVVFCDYGTVQQSVKWDPDSFRVAPGFGLRITVPGMGPAPIALDLAFPVAKAQGDSVQYFSFFVGLLR
ncbi:MAG: outer membrane protein assembly factor, partial [Pirellulales bacterium]